jgi:hypothetical protein
VKNTLSIKLLLYIILCSLGLTLVASSIQLYLEYQKAVNTVHDGFHFIEESYTPAITASSYDMDLAQLKLQLQGALKLPAVEYLEVVESRATGEIVIASEGNPNTKKDIFQEFIMEYTDAPERATQMAVLRVSASLEGVYKQLWQKVGIVLLTNAAQIFLGSFIIFMIIQSLITRHLIAMAKYTEKIDLDSLEDPLVLNRKRASSRVFRGIKCSARYHRASKRRSLIL